MTNQNLQWVRDIPGDLLEHYLKQEAVAVDTELHGLKLYRDEICLIQICDNQSNVCLVKPNKKQAPPNVKKLLTHPGVLKVFHFALTDVAFFKTSLEIEVTPFRCTKVMSKLVRTYTETHGLKVLCEELVGVELKKEAQQTNWASEELTPVQLQYAANDVLHLLKVYQTLKTMIENRPPLSTGMTVRELNDKAQQVLPHLIDLLVHGYGNLDDGWQTTIFSH